MEYKTGSYLINPRKYHSCNHCLKNIEIGSTLFARVKEYGEELTRSDGEKYRLKKYTRYHLDCAKTLLDLTDFELSLLNSKKTDPLNQALEILKKTGYKILYKDNSILFLKK